MQIKNPMAWMLAEAVAQLQHADRLQRQFFRVAAADGGPSWEPPVDICADGRTLGVLVALPGVAPRRNAWRWCWNTQPWLCVVSGLWGRPWVPAPFCVWKFPMDALSAGLNCRRVGIAWPSSRWRVMLPARNRKDLEALPQTARQQLEFVFLDDVGQVAQAAIMRADAAAHR